MDKKVRNILLITIFGILLLCTILSISYAFYVFNPDNKYETLAYTDIPACLNISINDDKPLTIEGDYAIPIKDSMLLNSSQDFLDKYKYSFSVTNSCDNAADIFLTFVPFKDSTIPVSALKYVLVPKGSTLPKVGNTFGDAKKLNSTTIEEIKLQKNYDIEYAYDLGNETYTAGQTKEYDLYVWIDYEEGGINNSTMDKSITATILISHYKNYN